MNGAEPIKKPFIKKLLGWYNSNHITYPWRQNIDPYCVWTSEIMLQQTQANTAIPYFNNWIKKMPDINSVTTKSLEYILKQWEGLGYYARARNFYHACQKVQDKFNGNVPNKYEDLISLPGIGPYIASAILSIAHNVPIAAIDVNAIRVYSRIFKIDFSLNKNRSNLTKLANRIISVKKPGNFNQAIMDLGRFICRPNKPLCQKCPIKQFCKAGISGSIASYPLKIQPKIKPKFHVAVGVVQKGNQILITKRRASGFLGGLWEFPGGKIIKKESCAECIIREIDEEIGIKVKPVKFIAQIKHQYSHFSITLDAYYCKHISGKPSPIECDDIKWINKKDLHKFPFPKANHKLFNFL
tara:strand:+ start:629 stop:1693 length:1065 start_codon:yes stop_codon:yes gene_type:complete